MMTTIGSAHHQTVTAIDSQLPSLSQTMTKVYQSKLVS
jgi:polysaccharide deacetylase 2 family uncharacterized protein YibQ